MKTTIFVGAGHANLEILQALTPEETSSNRFILVSPHPMVRYSGMIPRLIMGEIEAEDLSVNAKQFAQSKKIEYLETKVLRIDDNGKTIHLDNGQTLNFDILSLNIGGNPKRIESAVPYNTVYLKPFDEFIFKWREIQRICSACQPLTFVVVGGGAAALETAFALKVRLKRNGARKSEVHLITRGNRVCSNYSDRISQLLLNDLLKMGISVHLEQSVDNIIDKSITLKNGRKINFDYIFVSTPITPSAIEISAAVNYDARGFLQSDAALQVAPHIFAAGDCISIAGTSLPKSGVIAVRSGQFLIKNIRRALNGLTLFKFQPPVRTLNIIVNGDNSARFILGNFSFSGKLAMKIKNWIDEKYINKFPKISNK